MERSLGEPGREKLGALVLRQTLRSLTLSILFNLDAMMGSTLFREECEMQRQDWITFWG